MWRQPVPSMIVFTVLATLPALSAAQLPDPVACPQHPLESEKEWADRCYYEQLLKSSERNIKASQQRAVDTARQRAVLEQQPSLPASRNRLLGRWATRTPSAGNDPFAAIGAMLGGCILFGDGPVEFGPDRWAVYDSNGRNDVGAISYRAGANGAVFGLPAKGSIFEFAAV